SVVEPVRAPPLLAAVDGPAQELALFQVRELAKAGTDGDDGVDGAGLTAAAGPGAAARAHGTAAVAAPARTDAHAAGTHLARDGSGGESACPERRRRRRVCARRREVSEREVAHRIGRVLERLD